MGEPHSSSPLLYTMRELQDDTVALMEAINSQNKPAIITRMGRLIALIQPLGNVENLEGKLIAEAIASGEIKLADITGEVQPTSLGDDPIAVIT